MTTPDPTEADLLRTILEYPADDTPRAVYAEYLARRGHHDRADALYEAIGPRRTREYRAGPDAGVPFAVGVLTGRGFITDLTVGREAAGRVGEVLRAHPVERVTVLGPNVTVNIVPDGGRRVMTYHPGVKARTWGAVMTPPPAGDKGWSSVGAVWPTRDALVDGIGPWLLANLPPDIDEEEACWQQYGLTSD